MEDENVQIDKGTGLVMVCTFGDKTDTVWFKKFDLPYKQSIDLGGKFLPSIPLIAGLKVPEAREVVLQELEKQKDLSRAKEMEKIPQHVTIQ